MRLPRAARSFAGYGSPRIIAGIATATLVARIVVGRWSWGDLAVAGGILVVEPFLEWIIHVYGLHAKPKTLFGRQLDPLYARRHRMHHRDPRNVPLVFVPLPVLAGFLIVLGAIAFFAFPPLELKLTAFSTMTTFLFGYEWAHFLIHSTYVPRSFVFRAIWRNHILHHYKNEQYWFGVTNPIADFALRTHPAKDSVPSSPTARTLGVDDEFTLIRSGTTA
ncbi:MAG: sterol desaturase family protein [Candidatus Dormibacteraeota bacterium]|nr:sterol desaturase family protein [Candidatus Dormibacteraeota bacterium]